MQSPASNAPRPIAVGFHAGHVIQFLSQIYGDGFAVLREGVQNALDEGALKVYIRVDAVQGTIHIYDNGGGASEADIERKFANIGMSLKAATPGAMGQKGIGNLAGLAVANRWELVTRDTKGDNALRSFSFDRAELGKSAELRAHVERLHDGSAVRCSHFQSNTMLRLLEVDEVTLRQLRDVNRIVETLREAFNAKLKAKKILLRGVYRDRKNQATEFTVEPVLYRGAPMEPVTVKTEHGEVTFTFFHALAPVEKPNILIQHKSGYSITLENLFKLRILPREIEGAFIKGHFEGEIRVDFCTLNPSRTAFEHNHELRTFIQAVKQFEEDVLAPIIEQLEQSGREDKLQRIAEAVVRKMKQFLARNGRALPTVLHIRTGALTLERGNKDVPTLPPTLPKPGGGVGGEKHPPVCILRPVPSLTPTLPPTLPPSALKERSKEVYKERESGEPKKRVRSDRAIEVVDDLGVRLIYPNPDEGYLWHSRRSASGVIEINIANNDFGEAERRGQTVLSRYILLLLQKELTCASLTEGEAAVFGGAFERTFMSFSKASLE